jgi:hypothetical protein
MQPAQRIRRARTSRRTPQYWSALGKLARTLRGEKPASKTAAGNLGGRGRGRSLFWEDSPANRVPPAHVFSLPHPLKTQADR